MARVTADYRPLFAPHALLDRRASSLGCAGCGSCCEQIVIGFRPEDSSEPFIRENWHVQWREDVPRPVVDRHAYTRGYYRVICDAYDPETRRCTAYADRPHACYGYPWYDAPPVTGSTPDHYPHGDGDAHCSFWLDVPGWSRRGVRPLLPITDVTSGGPACSSPSL